MRAGIGWRPETAWLAAQRPFTEVVAEAIDPRRPPRELLQAIDRGLVVAVHGTTLSLGGAEPIDRARVAHLAAVAKVLRAPVASEHVAFARAGGATAAHFLPVPRTREQLAILVENVRAVCGELPVPLALENIAAPLAWPGSELAEADFLAELLERTGAQLLLDVANLHANRINGVSTLELARLPLHRVAYLHVAGGARVDAMWRDTHAHPIGAPVLALLREVLARTGPRPVLLERDHRFTDRAGLEAELAALDALLATAPAAAPHQPHARIPLPLVPDRVALAAAQHALIAGLAGDAALAGFPAAQVAETRAILAGKRERRVSAARSTPAGSAV